MRTVEEIKVAIKELETLANEHAQYGDYEGSSDFDAKAYALKWVLKEIDKI